MSDLISRGSAIDAICKTSCEITPQRCAELTNNRYCLLRKSLKELPSAEPKIEWIPVTERLPAEDGEYLVAYPIVLGDAATEVDILNYGKPTIPNEKVCGRCWYDYDAMYGDIVYDDVVAWMPLPPVYQGE